jgi:hypothetical protein
MTVTETTIPTLDRDDLAAIRKADSVCFRIHEGVATIECIKKDRDEFGDKERRRDVVVEGSISHASWSHEDRETFTRAWTYFGSAQYTEQWRTCTQLLRIGDTLKIEFRGDHGTNGLCKDANLHADELYLRVERGEGTNRKRLYFLLDAQVSLSNSARMVQP